MPSALRLQLLGEFTLLADDGEVLAVNTHRLQSFLAYLALHRDTPQPRQRLAFLFWPDSPEPQARANLRNLLHQLRQVLPRAGELLSTTADTVAWQPGLPIILDVTEFEAALACGAFQQAVELYRGDLLLDCYDDWVISERDRLQQLYLDALEQLIQQLEAAQHYRSAIEYAHRLLRIDPLHETTYRRLMRLYALSDDRIGIMRTYDACTAVLKRELDVRPGPETDRAYQYYLQMISAAHPYGESLPAAALPGEKSPAEAPPVDPADGPPNNLPLALTRFIGRKREKSKVRRLVADHRLVTLTGAGGVGKTRLALAVAAELLAEFPQGVWHIDLAPLNDTKQVMQAAASILGLRNPQARPTLAELKEQFHARCFLIVLDNCEHLVEIIRPMMEVVLSIAPHMHLLATSRVVLNIPGEINWCVPPLAVPDMSCWTSTGPLGEVDHTRGLQALRQYESVQVFIDRAAAVLPTFALTHQNARLVGTICQRLDGIPLALELAAARVRFLSLEQIADHLNDAFWLLAQSSPSEWPHHQTMRATMEWSYSLLTEPEKVLFRRLAVFTGGATYEAVEAVCSGEAIERQQVLNLLSGLVDKSLICLEGSSDELARFGLHEIARQYAHSLLAAAGELVLLRTRHLDYFCRLAVVLGADQSGILPPGAGSRLVQERYNLWAALEWSLQPLGDAPTGLRLATALPGYWELQGLRSEERAWLERLLAVAGTVVEPALRARALNAAGQVAYYQCDFPAARAYFERSLALDQEMCNQVQAADTLSRLGLLLCAQQQYAAADTYFQESLAIQRTLNNRGGIARLLSELGYSALRRGDYPRAHACLEESLALCRSPYDDYVAARGLHFLGHLARGEGDFEQAGRYYRRAAQLLKGLGNSWGLFYVLEAFGCLAAAQERYACAARLFGYGQQLGETIGTTYVPSEYDEHVHSEAIVRARLGEPAFAAEWDRGRAMTLDEALALALQ